MGLKIKKVSILAMEKINVFFWIKIDIIIFVLK